MLLCEFHCEWMWEETCHLVAADSLEEAVNLFVSDYRGVHTDKLVSHCQEDDETLICIEEFGSKHTEVTWSISVKPLEKGVLL